MASLFCFSCPPPFSYCYFLFVLNFVSLSYFQYRSLRPTVCYLKFSCQCFGLVVQMHHRYKKTDVNPVHCSLPDYPSQRHLEVCHVLHKSSVVLLIILVVSPYHDIEITVETSKSRAIIWFFEMMYQSITFPITKTIGGTLITHLLGTRLKCAHLKK